MTTEVELAALLRRMEPRIAPGEFLFCTLDPTAPVAPGIEPLLQFREPEGVTLVVTTEQAAAAGLAGTFRSRWITLGVYSSLNAVGFLAVVTATLARHEIGVNAVSAYHHDHLFVPTDRAAEALALLRELADRGQPLPGGET